MKAIKQTSAPETRELIAWVLYDFANSGYTTVILTTIYSAYFVGVIAAELDTAVSGSATFVWSLTIACANLTVMLAGPVVGAIADYRASKKKFLVVSSLVCILATALLAAVRPGEIVLAATLICLSAIAFSFGENLIAAFLPELAPKDRLGRLSGYGWSVGYFGGLLTLAGCLALIQWGRQEGWPDTTVIPYTIALTAAIFAMAALPTFLWLRERAVPGTEAGQQPNFFKISFQRLRHTFSQATHYSDLFRFLLALAVYQSGVSTVIVLAAIYAQEVMGFAQQQLIVLIMAVNVAAAGGALLCGLLQDGIGSIPTLMVTLVIWIAGILTAYFGSLPLHMWISGCLIGLAMGASQSVGRALVSKFTPEARSGEFLGLWGLVVRLSAIMGPLSYGLVNLATGGNHRAALLATLTFFVVGFLLLFNVNEQRGMQAASVADR